MNIQGTASAPFPIFGLLGILFIGLKLGGVIEWSWWWVTLPFWGGAAVVVFFFGVAALLMGAAKILERVSK